MSISFCSILYLTTKKQLDLTYKNIVYHIYKSLDTIVSLVQLLIKGRFFLSKIEKATSAIVVAGNGPSLLEGLMWVKSNATKAEIAATNFYLLDDNLPNPKYYFITDDRFFGNRSKLSIGSERKDAELVTLVDELYRKLNHLDIPLVLFVPKRYFRLAKTKIKNDNISIKSININAFDSWAMIRNYVYTRNLGVPMAQTVLISALFNSLHMTKEIYLVGCDSNWLDELKVTKENVVYTNLRHNDGSTVEITYSSMRHALETQVNVFKSYEYISNWAQSINAEITNLSENSYIDIFKKIK